MTGYKQLNGIRYENQLSVGKIERNVNKISRYLSLIYIFALNNTVLL